MVLGVVRREMAMFFFMMRGLSMDNPRTVWGLLK